MAGMEGVLAVNPETRTSCTPRGRRSSWGSPGTRACSRSLVRRATSSSGCSTLACGLRARATTTGARRGAVVVEGHVHGRRRLQLLGLQPEAHRRAFFNRGYEAAMGPWTRAGSRAPARRRRARTHTSSPPPARLSPTLTCSGLRRARRAAWRPRRAWPCTRCAGLAAASAPTSSPAWTPPSPTAAACSRSARRRLRRLRATASPSARSPRWSRTSWCRAPPGTPGPGARRSPTWRLGSPPWARAPSTATSRRTSSSGTARTTPACPSTPGRLPRPPPTPLIYAR
ncbi:hypothetical protein D1007_21307 [Hordeum vulgare]|nr:hypothetical protein D1007_21307 [Hordeum vulgare]